MKKFILLTLLVSLIFAGCNSMQWETEQFQYATKLKERLPDIGSVKTNEDFERAKAQCFALIEEEPRFATAHLTLSGLYADQSDFDLAIKEVTTAIEMVENKTAMWAEVKNSDDYLKIFQRSLSAYKQGKRPRDYR